MTAHPLYKDRLVWAHFIKFFFGWISSQRILIHFLPHNSFQLWVIFCIFFQLVLQFLHRTTFGYIHLWHARWKPIKMDVGVMESWKNSPAMTILAACYKLLNWRVIESNLCDEAGWLVEYEPWGFRAIGTGPDSCIVHENFFHDGTGEGTKSNWWWVIEESDDVHYKDMPLISCASFTYTLHVKLICHT